MSEPNAVEYKAVNSSTSHSFGDVMESNSSTKADLLPLLFFIASGILLRKVDVAFQQASSNVDRRAAGCFSFSPCAAFFSLYCVPRPSSWVCFTSISFCFSMLPSLMLNTPGIPSSSFMLLFINSLSYTRTSYSDGIGVSPVLFLICCAMVDFPTPFFP